MKKLNFGAGPCILPEAVFEEASKAVVDFNGLSILEISHRSPEFVAVMEEARQLVRELLNVPEDYTILFLQGGASLGFLISAMNMAREHKKAGYINTGAWASKAIIESEKLGLDTVVLASSKEKNFNYIPDFNLVEKVDYLHFTSNNTIYGTQFKEFPSVSCPLVCDMSSDIFSKEIDVSKFDLIYAGAQKNIGPAGSTLYIVKNTALGKSSFKSIPTYLDLETHAKKDSMFNTPPVFAIYTAMLNLRYLKQNGGIKEIEKLNNKKAALLYSEIDNNPSFEGTANKNDRSTMNVTFTLKDDKDAEAFDNAWKSANIVGLKGHRSVGGYRASMYNALTIDAVERLVDVMHNFK
ncbi:3-phosphoserine/phosphohydroxythreonine transaminase [Crocinitomix algicola]|uniref:3-phosphoserine/phosphohydroxythreonine transaminase n=1 Tax=Crocinitomix algicola TaxID=1740263 RepID=UPI00082DAABB|nr:3-phosphoserine/phosphohydroxythreonine transaminase [Crocinitomix algicola]